MGIIRKVLDYPKPRRCWYCHGTLLDIDWDFMMYYCVLCTRRLQPISNSYNSTIPIGEEDE